jgi:diadenosine tetraphosphatase ApaH/serine/threonine PP2A family protein phosphatase
MKYGIISDIHSNLQALETVLEYLAEEAVDELYCLGDVVGYGGDPVACVAIVDAHCEGTVRGNHDVAVVDSSVREWFNPHARAAIERQVELLGQAELSWLSGLPATLQLGDVGLTHSGFVDPAAFGYVLNGIQAAAELRALPGRVGFLGHTHVPGLFRETEDDGVEVLPLGPDATTRGLEGPDRYLVNPGAVGQPRDRDPRAACAIFDSDSSVLVYRRLEYDVAGAQEAIARSGMPPFEAMRLTRGL